MCALPWNFCWNSDRAWSSPEKAEEEIWKQASGYLNTTTWWCYFNWQQLNFAQTNTMTSHTNAGAHWWLCSVPFHCQWRRALLSGLLEFGTHSFALGPRAKEGEAGVEETKKRDVLQAASLENWCLTKGTLKTRSFDFGFPNACNEIFPKKNFLTPRAETSRFLYSGLPFFSSISMEPIIKPEDPSWELTPEVWNGKEELRVRL